VISSSQGDRWRTATIKSSNRKLNDECLSLEMFGVVADKRWKLGYLHSEYSHKCPNSALGDGAPGQNSPPRQAWRKVGTSAGGRTQCTRQSKIQRTHSPANRIWIRQVEIRAQRSMHQAESLCVRCEGPHQLAAYLAARTCDEDAVQRLR